MPYCDTSTLLLGGIPLRAEVSLDSFVADAADEIDSVLGFVYATPITESSEGKPLPRPVQLALARINRYLASGRYILSVASGGEDNQVHAYGQSLIKEALAALNQIASGAIDLDAKKIPNAADVNKGPAMLNAEAFSNVDAFYGAYTGPDGMMFSPNRFLSPAPLEVPRGW